MSSLVSILSMNPIEEESLSSLLHLAFTTRSRDLYEDEQLLDLRRGRDMIAAEIRRRRALLAQCPDFTPGDSVEISQPIQDWPYAGSSESPPIGTRGKVVAFHDMHGLPPRRAWHALVSRRHYAIVKFGPRFAYAPGSTMPVPRWCLRHAAPKASA